MKIPTRLKRRFRIISAKTTGVISCILLSLLLCVVIFAPIAFIVLHNIYDLSFKQLLLCIGGWILITAIFCLLGLSGMDPGNKRRDVSRIKNFFRMQQHRCIEENEGERCFIDDSGDCPVLFKTSTKGLDFIFSAWVKKPVGFTLEDFEFCIATSWPCRLYEQEDYLVSEMKIRSCYAMIGDDERLSGRGRLTMPFLGHMYTDLLRELNRCIPEVVVKEAKHSWVRTQ